MRKIYLLVFFLSIAFKGIGQVFTVDTIYYHGDPDNRINLIIMGDGYLNSEIPQFRLDAQSVADYFFSIEPFSTYKNFFNFFAIEVVSNESGTNHPATASDCPGGQPIAVVDNYLNTTFDYGGTHRCVFSNQTSIVYTVANANFPAYDFINVIINSTYYGGCAGGVAFTTMNSSSPEVFAHEFGHMFGQLADEYEYGGSNCSVGSSQGINVSQVTDTSLLVWKKWLTAPTFPTPNGTSCGSIGLYPGAQYCDSNWYRPKCDCKMRSLGEEYCEVCYEQFIFKISTKVNYIEGHLPLLLNQNLCQGTQQLFSVNVLDNADSTVRVQWFLDNSLVSPNSNNFLLNTSLVAPGNHQLRAVAYDTTLHARKTLTTYSQLWNINVMNAAITSTDSLNFCLPDSAMLHAVTGAGYSYQWFRNNQLLSGETHSDLIANSSGNYSVVVSNGSCQDTSSQVVVTANPLPAAAINVTGNDTICSGGAALLTANLCGTCIGQWKKNGLNIPGATNDSVSVNTSGAYTISVTNTSTDCSVLSTAQSVYLSLINAVATGSVTTFCSNDSAILTVQPQGMFYQWYRNNVLLPGSVNDSLVIHLQGNYFSNVTDGACSDSSNPVVVTVNTSPNVSFTGLDDSLCIYHSPVTLTGNPAGGTFTAAGITGNVFDPSVAGAGSHDVSYLFTDANGCTGQYSENVFVDFCSGIEDINHNSSIVVYPNPSEGKFEVRNVSSVNLKVDMMVVDLLGKHILSLTSEEIIPGGKSLEVNCTVLPEGVYLLRIQTGKQTYLKRLTIIK